MRLTAFVFVLALGTLPACDSNNSDGNGGSLTSCDLSFEVTNASGKDYGLGCTSDTECQYGECLMPGTGGNITNTQFGFCSRGCDCENATASQIPADQKEHLDCLYPSGFKSLHHIVVECNSVADCQALDPRWNDCKLPSTGGARKVCHAL